MSKDFEKILSDIDLPLEDTRFAAKAFRELTASKKADLEKEADPLKKIILEDFAELSARLDKSLVQESSSVRNILRTRDLAILLIKEDGELDQNLIKSAINLLKDNLYSLGPDRQFDGVRNEQILNVLTALSSNKQLVSQLRMISRPQMHKYAEQLIRDTIQLPAKTTISDAHTRRAVLSAWLCYLRQNVGSCFATAPAIIIHDEQFSTFLKDIQELLSTGRLKRTFSGIEYAVPLSYSWGAGDLRKLLLLSKSFSADDFTFWRSPGLLKALEAMGVISSDVPLKEKVELCKQKVIAVLEEWKTNAQWFYVSVEGMIRQILLNHYDLTEEEITEYELRPQGMIHGGVFMEAAASAKASGGKGKKIQEFLHKFDEGTTAFKSLADNALLKAWEFTLASFSETKAEFTRWNLYSSLGLGPQERGGIGYCLYEILKRKLDECNQAIEEHQILYEQLYSQLIFAQGRLQNAGSEKEASWLRAEYQSKLNEFQMEEQIRNDYHARARIYANLFDQLIDAYDRLFPKYFQEIYDADIHEVNLGPYDDSPAGFRLLYKHGRSNTSLWVGIKTPSEFIDALANFFITTETEIAGSREFKGFEEDLSTIVSAVVMHVRSPEFIETAFYRMAAAHNVPAIKNPLEHLDKIEKKPWVYTSGGSMNTLLSCYFRLDSKPTEVARWVENPVELLVFLIDSVKELPEKIHDEIIANPKKSFLIHSPTHAFLLKPGVPMFLEAWNSKAFTYTWVRDYVVKPMEDFNEKIFLNSEAMQFIIEELVKLVPHNNRHFFMQAFSNLGGSMQASDFRQYIMDTIEITQGLQLNGRGVLSTEQIDSLMFSLLPIFPSYQLQERVKAIVEQLPGISAELQGKVEQIVNETSRKFGAPTVVSAKGLQDIVKSTIALATGRTSFGYDLPYEISRIAQKAGYALPTPFIFADTNWVKDQFGFVVNPGSGKFEMWRVDYTGSIGAPMVDWKQWLDGSRKKPDWGVYPRPYEYKY